MKVFGKWIVKCRVEGFEGSRMAAHFGTKKEATERLNEIFGDNRNERGEWIGQRGQRFYIEKNTVEY